MRPPETLAEWGEYIHTLDPGECFRQAVAANTWTFIDRLKDEGRDLKYIKAVMMLFVQRLLRVDAVIPSLGVFNLQRLTEEVSPKKASHEPGLSHRVAVKHASRLVSRHQGSLRRASALSGLQSKMQAMLSFGGGGIWLVVADHPPTRQEAATLGLPLVQSFNKFRDEGGLFYVSDRDTARRVNRVRDGLHGLTVVIWVTDVELIMSAMPDLFAHRSGLVKLAAADGEVKVRRKDTGRVVYVSPETLKENGGEYEELGEGEESGEPEKTEELTEGLIGKDIDRGKEVVGGIERPEGWRDSGGEPELEAGKEAEWEAEHMATTPVGSVVIGTTHPDMSDETDPGTQLMRNNSIPLALETARKALGAGKKVVYFAEGEPANYDLDSEKDHDEHHATGKALHKEFGDKVELSTWDDAPVDIFDQDSPVWERLDNAAGNRESAQASMAVFLLGQGDDVTDLRQVDILNPKVEGLVKDRLGIDLSKSLSDEDREEMYDLAFPGDSGKAPNDISAVGDVYNAARQDNLLKKIREVEADGGVAIATVGGSHAWNLKPVLEGGQSKKSSMVFLVAARYQKKKEVPKAEGKGTTTVYEYSDRQVANRNREKAKKVEKLRGKIGDVRKKYKADLTSKDEKTRFTALAVALMDATFERVGNEESAKEGHVGVTGWQKKHLTFSGGHGNGKDKVTVKYVGKSGVKHEKVVEDATLVSALKKAVEGKEPEGRLCEGEDCRVDASDVNEYLKPFGITAKDVRGFHANAEMQTRLKAVRSAGGKLPEDKKERDKKLKEEFKKALGETAEAVGHEAATLRTQYLVPGLEEEYIKEGEVSEKLDKKGSSSVSPLALKQIEVFAKKAGQTSQVNLNIVGEALFAIGWGLVEGDGAAALSNHEQFENGALKPWLQQYNATMWGYHGTKEPQEVWFKSKVDAAVAVKTIWRYVEKCGRKGPTHPKRGVIYLADLLGYRLSQQGRHTLVTRFWFMGVPSYTVVTSDGKEMKFMPSVDDRGRVADTSRMKAARLFTWGYKNGLQQAAQAYLDAGGMDAILEVKKQRELAIRSLENTGTCPACFRNVKMVKRQRMIRHGWEVKGGGWRSYGTWHSGPCFGTGYQPFELSKKGTEDYRKAVEQTKGVIEKKLQGLKAEPEELPYQKTVVLKGTHDYDYLLKSLILNTERELDGAVQELRDLDAKISGWSQQPLPGQRTAFQNKKAIIHLDNATDGDEDALRFRGVSGLISSLTLYEQAVVRDMIVQGKPILRVGDLGQEYTLRGHVVEPSAVNELVAAEYLENKGNEIVLSPMFLAKLKLYTASMNRQAKIYEKDFSLLDCSFNGDFYFLPLDRDRFVHFVPESEAPGILKSRKIRKGLPYHPRQNISAASLFYGSYLDVYHHPRGNEPVVGIVFKTKTPPALAHKGEVVWDKDVDLQQAKVVDFNRCLSMLSRSLRIDKNVMIYHQVPNWCTPLTKVAMQDGKKKTAGTIVPLRPKGPVIKIRGKQYVLSDDGGPLFHELAEMGGPNVIHPPASQNKWKYLWVYNTDKQDLGMFRVTDGNEKVFGSAHSQMGQIARLDRKGQLNRVTHREMEDITREMRKKEDETFRALQRSIKENESAYQKRVNELALEFFNRKIRPDIERDIRSVENGVVPLGFKFSPRMEAHGKSRQQQMVTEVIYRGLSRLKTDNIEDYLLQHGIDPEKDGDSQAAYWARNDIVDGMYEELSGGRKFRFATKTHTEKEDEEAERLVRPAPKLKPPRHDRRRERVEIEGEDPDQDKEAQCGKVAARWFRRVADEKDPGKWWETDSGWAAKNMKGETRYGLPNREQAEAYAKGEGKPKKEPEPEKDFEAELEDTIRGLDPDNFKPAIKQLQYTFGPKGHFSDLKPDDLVIAGRAQAISQQGLTSLAKLFKGKTIKELREFLDNEELHDLAGKPEPDSPESDPPEPEKEENEADSPEPHFDDSLDLFEPDPLEKAVQALGPVKLKNGLAGLKAMFKDKGILYGVPLDQILGDDALGKFEELGIEELAPLFKGKPVSELLDFTENKELHARAKPKKKKIESPASLEEAKQTFDTFVTDLKAAGGGWGTPKELEPLEGLSPEQRQIVANNYNKQFNELMGDVSENGISATALKVAAKAMAGKKGGGSLEEVGRNLAALAFARRVVANPLLVGGQAVNNEPKTPEQLQARAKTTFDQYSQTGKEVRREAMGQLGAQLQGVSEKSPKHKELSSILDGLALVAELNGEEVPVGDRSPAPEGLKTLAKSLGENVGILLQPLDKMYGPEGRKMIQDALDELDDRDLYKVMGGEKGTWGSVIKAMDGASPEVKKWAKNFLKGVATNEMTFARGLYSTMAMDKVKEEESDEAGTSSQYRTVEELMEGAYKIAEHAPKLREAIDNWRKECLERDGSEESLEQCKKLGDETKLAQLQSFLDAAHEKFGELDDNEPIVAILHHAIETGDLDSLEIEVREPGENPPPTPGPTPIPTAPESSSPERFGSSPRKNR